MAVSGSGNVAQHCVEKLLHLGAVAVTMSDSSGYVYEPSGFDRAKLDLLMELKNVKHARISEYCEHSPSAVFHAGKRPWEVPRCRVAA